MGYRKPNSEETKQIRAIAKSHGIGRVRKGTGKRAPVYVGVQCERMTTEVASALVAGLEEAGYVLDPIGEDTTRELIAKGLADSLMIYKAV